MNTLKKAFVCLILPAAIWSHARSQASLPLSDANWVSLGSVPGADGAVNAIFRDPTSGMLYVGGAFKVAGTAVSAGVAKWDGTNWFPLSTGVGGTVRAF